MVTTAMSLLSDGGKLRTFGMVVPMKTLKLQRGVWNYRFRGFGGGFGFGTPVVSYAPRPMFIGASSLSIIWVL